MMDYKSAFLSLHKDFFQPEKLDFMNEEEVYEEQVLYSGDFHYETFTLPVPENVKFRYADCSDKKEMEKLQKAVAAVDKDWVQYFKGTDGRIYCGFSGEKIASFCLVDEMGTYSENGKIFKIGGPGCVGTVPEFRRNGIGLKMVLNVTKILFDEGADISWIHYTGVGRWYEKLGYKTVLKWNKKGFID